jgi:hypothetical protein
MTTIDEAQAITVFTLPECVGQDRFEGGISKKLEGAGAVG